MPPKVDCQVLPTTAVVRSARALDGRGVVGNGASVRLPRGCPEREAPIPCGRLRTPYRCRLRKRHQQADGCLVAANHSQLVICRTLSHFVFC